MKHLLPIGEAPKEPAWWRNSGHGRRLTCGHDSALVFVPVTGGFCARCNVPLQLLTADPEAADRLRETV